MSGKTHLYIFFAGSTHLGIAAGDCAHNAYQELIRNNPNLPRFQCTAWRLGDEAEGIPVGALK